MSDPIRHSWPSLSRGALPEPTSNEGSQRSAAAGFRPSFSKTLPGGGSFDAKWQTPTRPPQDSPSPALSPEELQSLLTQAREEARALGIQEGRNQALQELSSELRSDRLAQAVESLLELQIQARDRQEQSIHDAFVALVSSFGHDAADFGSLYWPRALQSVESALPSPITFRIHPADRPLFLAALSDRADTAFIQEDSSLPLGTLEGFHPSSQSGVSFGPELLRRALLDFLSSHD